MKYACALIALAAVSLVSHKAQADEHRLASGVRLIVDSESCESGSLDVDELVALLRVELFAAESSASSDLELSLAGCAEELGQALLRVERHGGNLTERTADLSKIAADVRPRALALIFADLIRTTPIGAVVANEEGEAATSTEQTTSASPQPVIRPTLSRAGSSSWPRVFTRGSLIYRYYSEHETPLFGAAAWITRRKMQLGFLAAAGRYNDHLGTIVLGSAALSGSLDVLVWNPISLRVAGDAGLAWASGTATDEASYGQDAVTPHLAIHLDLAVRLLQVGSVALEVGGSAGYATGLIANVGDRQVAGITGLFAGALVGVHLPL